MLSRVHHDSRLLDFQGGQTSAPEGVGGNTANISLFTCVVICAPYFPFVDAKLYQLRLAALESQQKAYAPGTLQNAEFTAAMD